MSPKSKLEYLRSIVERYRKSSRDQKSQMLNEFCATCGYNRKYAIRRILGFKIRHRPQKALKRGPQSRYADPVLIKTLREIWIASHLPCSKRLKAILPLWIGPYQHEFGALTKEVTTKLLIVSSATIDRIICPIRSRYRGKGRCATKPGLLLRHQIPIKTGQWDEAKPGHLEADTVAHCGVSLSGQFAYTVDMTDIATEWTEQRAVWGKGETDVLKAIEDIESSLPFDILGFDCDNGSEFLNWHLLKYFRERKKPVEFTRSRAYKKDDNAHIEQKNWTHVRQWIGYRRLDDPEIVRIMNDLYRNEWRLFQNFFLPYMKLKEKRRIGSKIIKIHDSPKTPYQRVLDSPFVLPEKKRILKEQYKTLNPFKLRKAIDEKIAQIHRLAR